MPRSPAKRGRPVSGRRFCAEPAVTFDAPWQARAFAVCLALLEQRGEGWDAFQPHLAAAIAADPDAPYYQNFVAALEAFSKSACDNPSL